MCLVLNILPGLITLVSPVLQSAGPKATGSEFISPMAAIIPIPFISMAFTARKWTVCLELLRASFNRANFFTYEFDAEPFGLHLYHCHAFPLARHIAKGLYGAFIIDPPGGWPAVDHEFVMVMNGFDVDFDDVNDFYAVNTIPFHFQLHPIQIKVGEKVRIYLVNILEYDLINSFHLHANFFQYYPTGTSLTPAEFTDTIMQTQAQHGILEFSYKFPGLYMFHAHNTEFAELGWTGNFLVTE